MWKETPVNDGFSSLSATNADIWCYEVIMKKGNNLKWIIANVYHTLILYFLIYI